MVNALLSPINLSKDNTYFNRAKFSVNILQFLKDAVITVGVSFRLCSSFSVIQKCNLTSIHISWQNYAGSQQRLQFILYLRLLFEIKILLILLKINLFQSIEFWRTTFIFNYSNFWSICTLFARIVSNFCCWIHA